MHVRFRQEVKIQCDECTLWQHRTCNTGKFFHSYSCSVVRRNNSMVYNIFDKNVLLSLTFIFLQYTLFATSFSC